MCCGVLILAVMKSYPEPVEGYAARGFDKLSERGEASVADPKL